VGASGIEAALESSLKGVNGGKIIQAQNQKTKTELKIQFMVKTFNLGSFAYSLQKVC